MADEEGTIETQPAPEPSEQEPKKPGRPAGAKNRPKAPDPVADPEPTIKRRRKPVEEIADTASAIDSRAAELETLIERHNAQHPTAQKRLQIIEASALGDPIPPDLIAHLYRLTMKVATKGFVSDDDLAKHETEIAYMADRCSEASRYWITSIDPKWVVTGIAAASLATVTVTIADEADQRKKQEQNAIERSAQ